MAMTATNLYMLVFKSKEHIFYRRFYTMWKLMMRAFGPEEYGSHNLRISLSSKQPSYLW